MKCLQTTHSIVFLLLSALLQAPAHAQSEAIDVTLEIREFDCATRPDQLEACNAALSQLAAAAGVPKLASYESIMPGRQVISYTTSIVPGQSLQDSTSSGDSVLEVEIAVESPMPGRYQLDIESRHSTSGEPQSGWASSMLIEANEDPQVMAAGTEEGLELVEGVEREVVVVELKLLTVAER